MVVIQQLQNTGIYVCQSLLLDHLIDYGGPLLLCLLHTQLYFNNQVSCLIRDWRFHQVSSLKYFSNDFISISFYIFDVYVWDTILLFIYLFLFGE